MKAAASGARVARGFSSVLLRAFPPPRFLLPRTCGVDISDASIKWMMLTDGPEGERKVLSWGDQKLEPGIVVNGIVQDPVGLGKALVQIRPKIAPAEAAHASLPEEAAYIFGMHVPDGSSREQIFSLIEFEFEGRVPIPPPSAIYDYSVIRAHEEGGEEISVCVFPKEVVGAYADAFGSAGIPLHSLEVEASSIGRAVSSNEEAEPITLLVDFGRTRTGFAVLKCGVPIFTSTVDIGGGALIERVAKALSVSRDEAQLFCNEQGLVPQEKGSSEGAEAIAGTASALSDEIAKHFHYWDTRRNDQGERVTPVGQIVLVGGNSNLRGLPEYIASRVQAPVRPGNIWRHVCNFDTYVPPIDTRTSLEFATAAGLALRGM